MRTSRCHLCRNHQQNCTQLHSIYLQRTEEQADSRRRPARRRAAADGTPTKNAAPLIHLSFVRSFNQICRNRIGHRDIEHRRVHSLLDQMPCTNVQRASLSRWDQHVGPNHTKHFLLRPRNNPTSTARTYAILSLHACVWVNRF